MLIYVIQQPLRTLLLSPLDLFHILVNGVPIWYNCNATTTCIYVMVLPGC